MELLCGTGIFLCKSKEDCYALSCQHTYLQKLVESDSLSSTQEMYSTTVFRTSLRKSLLISHVMYSAVSMRCRPLGGGLTCTSTGLTGTSIPFSPSFVQLLTHDDMGSGHRCWTMKHGHRTACENPFVQQGSVYGCVCVRVCVFTVNRFLVVLLHYVKFYTGVTRRARAMQSLVVSLRMLLKFAGIFDCSNDITMLCIWMVTCVLAYYDCTPA